MRGSLEKTAVEFSLEVSQVRQLLEEGRRKLYDVRQQRPRPHRDDKILTAWNGKGKQVVIHVWGLLAGLRQALKTMQHIDTNRDYFLCTQVCFTPCIVHITSL